MNDDVILVGVKGIGGAFALRLHDDLPLLAVVVREAVRGCEQLFMGVHERLTEPATQQLLQAAELATQLVLVASRMGPAADADGTLAGAPADAVARSEPPAG